jgi:hypothetical protein
MKTIGYRSAGIFLFSGHAERTEDPAQCVGRRLGVHIFKSPDPATAVEGISTWPGERPALGWREWTSRARLLRKPRS